MKVIGLEPDPHYLERARIVAEELKQIVSDEIAVYEADPVLNKDILPMRAETVIFPRTLHELLLLHKNDPQYLQKLAKTMSRIQKNGDKLLLVDPNYRHEVNSNPENYAEEILSAIKKIAVAYGHFHPTKELPNPQELVPAFEKEGYQLVETSWKANESTILSPIVGAHFTVFEKISQA
jgi:hypothetical protein